MVSRVEGAPFTPPPDRISSFSLQPGSLPNSSTNTGAVDAVPQTHASSGHLQAVSQACKAVGKGFAGVLGALGLAAGGTAALLTQGLFLAHVGVTGAMGIAGGLSLGAVGLLATAPLAPFLAEESPEADFVFSAATTVGATAGAAVPVALMAIGSLALAVPYFASKALMNGSSRLLQHAGAAEKNLDTYKNFVLFMETLSSGRKFVVTASDETVPKVLPEIDLATRLKRYNETLVKGPEELEFKARFLHWLGTHGIGSSYLVPVVQEEPGKYKYVKAEVLRTNFGFSANETYKISNMKPEEAVAKCTQLYANREMRRLSLINDVASTLQQPVENFTRNEYEKTCRTYHKEGFVPAHMLQEAYEKLGKDQQKKSAGMYQLWLIAIQSDTEEGGARKIFCEEGIKWAKQNGCFDQFLLGLREIRPWLAKHFEERERVVQKTAEGYVSFLQLSDEKKDQFQGTNAFWIFESVVGEKQEYWEKEEREIIQEALIQAARQVNPRNPKQVLDDLINMFQTEIDRLGNTPVSEVSGDVKLKQLNETRSRLIDRKAIIETAIGQL